jgi:hypothetical protein
MSSLRDDQELLALQIEEAIIEGEFTMRNTFGWDLPPGVTPNDIEEAMGSDEEEISTTGALAAILDEEIEEDGLTGKPYADDETPITEKEAQEVIEEMRKAVSSDGTVSLARAWADETGLEVDKDDMEEYLYLHGWEESQADQDYWQRVMRGEE